MPHFESIEVPGGLGHTFDRVVTEKASRAQVFRRGAVAVGALAGVGLLDAAPALAWWGGQPRPIPGGFDQNFNPVPKDPFVHVLPPALGFEMATITDFRGVVAATEIQGKAHGSDGSTYTFDTDMRFMQGHYVGRDGRKRWGTFGFV
jgi:hypothetical protein